MSDEFLIKDFEHWTEAYNRNEEGGERRLSFFVGLVTAVFGALGFLGKKGDTLDLGSIREIAIASALALFGFGLLTLFRLVRRNMSTDGYLHAIRTIRAKLAPSEQFVEECIARLPRQERSVLNGGLAHINAFINAWLFSVAIGLTAWTQDNARVGPMMWAGVAFVAAAAVQDRVLIPVLQARARKR